MNKFSEISPYEMSGNPISAIGKEWMLVTAASENGADFGKDYNTMTASWGGVGVLWGKPVAFVFIRPERHTFSFTEKGDLMTLSFFSEEYKGALAVCGKKSGRDTDKAAECSLTPRFIEDSRGRYAYFDEASRVLLCRKLYSADIEENRFIDLDCLESYKNGGFHKMYICEITKVMDR